MVGDLSYSGIEGYCTRSLREERVRFRGMFCIPIVPHVILVNCYGTSFNTIKAQNATRDPERKMI